MKTQPANKTRPILATIALLGLSCYAQPVGNLPGELEPYFAAIRMVESKNHPWTIFDNTTRQSYRLNTRTEAETKAGELIKYGHNVDLGLMQLNCRYQCNRPGVGLANIFDPVINVNTAKVIFLEFWEQARRISTDFNARIIAAVGAYNNGRVGTPNTSYVQKVWQQMGKAIAQLPDPGTGQTEQAPGNKGILDETLSRAEKGVTWARERLDAITKHKDNAKNTQQQNPQDNRRETETSLGIAAIVGLFAALAAALYFLAPFMLKLVSVFGKKAVAKTAIRAANTRRKQIESQMNG